MLVYNVVYFVDKPNAVGGQSPCCVSLCAHLDPMYTKDE